MIRDRGLIKWQPAHFMPEHRKMLNTLQHVSNKHKKPQLDEQELEEIGIVVTDSLNCTLPVRITVWQDGYFKNYSGIVSKVDPLMKQIHFDAEGHNEQIMFCDITAAERI